MLPSPRSYQCLIPMLAQALALAFMNILWSKIRNVNFTFSPYTCYVKTTVQACCGLRLLQSMQLTLYHAEKTVRTWIFLWACMTLSTTPCTPCLLFSSLLILYESLLSPSAFFILLSFYIHMRDFEYLNKNLEVTMEEHSGYLSFWEWFNSLNRSVSTRICFSTKNTNQHFKFLLPVFWHFLQWNVNRWSQGSQWTCSFLSISKFTSNQTK